MNKPPSDGVVLVVGRAIDTEAIRRRITAQIVAVDTIREALTRTRTRNICGVVSDHPLPDGTGIELLERIRENHPTVPVVLWTDDGDEATASKAITAGISEYISKRETADVRAIDRIQAQIAAWRDAGENAQPNGGDTRQLTRYETMFETVSDGICVLTRDSEFVEVNDGFVELTGYSREHLLGNHASMVRPESLNETFDEVQAALDGGSDVETIEMEIQTAAGEDRTVEARYAQFDYDGKSGRIGVWRDITDRNEREQKLELFRTLVDHASDGIYVIDSDSAEILDANDASCRMLGYSRSELLSRSVPDINPEFSTATWDDHVDAIPHDGELVIESTHQRKDGSTFPVEIKVTHVSLESEYYVAVVRDITDRKAREQELKAEKERFRSLLEAAPDPIFVADAATGEIVETNTAACEIRDQPREEILGLHQTALHPDDEQERYRALFEQHVNQGGAVTRFEGEQVCLTTAVGERIPVSISTETVSFDGRTLIQAVFRDISKQQQYQEALENLNTATQSFIEAKTEHEVAQNVVDIASEVLELSGTAVYFYDDDAGALTPAAYSSDLEERIGAPPTLSPGSGIPWRVYVEQEPAILDDERTGSDADCTEVPFSCELVLPMGEHGVVLVGDTSAGNFDEGTVDLATILTTTAEAAVDRVEWAEQLQVQKDQAQRQSQQLERVNQINDKIRRSIQAIIDAETRQGVEQAVCTHLTDLDRFAFAWIGEPEYVLDKVTPEAWAGPDASYLDRLSLEFDAGRTDPAVRAIREQETTVVPTIAAKVGEEPWRRKALRHEFRSAISVPLVNDDVLYGALTIYATQASAFDDRSTAVLTEVGKLVGYGINAVERRNAFSSTDTVELTFELPYADDTFVDLASRLGTELEVINMSARSDEEYLVQTIAHDIDPSRIREVTDNTVIIDEMRIIRDTDPVVFELIVSGSCIATDVAPLTGMSRRIRFSERANRVTVVVPRDRDVQSFIAHVRDEHPDAKVVRRQTTDREATRSSPSVVDDLTPRQQEVLQTAYYGGFFEQPRNSTGTDIADALDISQPAFSKQLRKGERKLLQAIYEAE